MRAASIGTSVCAINRDANSATMIVIATCVRKIGELEQRTDEVLAEETTPWHFKLLVAAVVVYLGWRFIEIFV